MKKFLHNQNGSVMVIVAFCMVAFMGMAAFSVDLGASYVTKSNLQKAADAAALAGAQMLPSVSDAKAKALEYAGKNGINVSGGTAITNGIQTVETKVITPYNGNSSRVQVTCTRTVNYIFAKVLGINSGTVTVTSVAENDSQWDGEALPFMNLGDNYETAPNGLIVWTKQAPGDMGTIHDFKTITEPETYFEIDYSNGITIVEGYSNGLKGLDGSTLKTGIEDILSDATAGQKFYVFSLKASVIQTLLSGGSLEVSDQNGNRKLRYLGAGGGFKNDDVIDKDDLVLIEVEYVSADLSNNHNIQLKYTGKQYTLTGTDFPPGIATSGVIKLVE